METGTDKSQKEDNMPENINDVNRSEDSPQDRVDYVKTPIGDLYRRLLPSAIGSLLTATVASLIDVMILSYYLGPEMLAVIGLCMPVYMLVNTLGMLIASGACTIYTQYLGEGNRDEALRYYTASVVHLIICGAVLSAVGFAFPERVLDILGANEAVMEPTAEYIRILFFFMIPLMLYIHLLFFVRVDSDPNCALAATFSCAVTNLVLDILFVGPLGWGPRGAALATCLAYAIGMLVNMTHFVTGKSSLKFVRKSVKGRGLRIWKAGLPLAASQLGMSISTNIFNNVVIRVGSEDYVSVYSIITQLSMTSMAVYEGVGQAAQPIVAAASGAGDKDRISKVFRYGMRLELIGTIVLAALYIIFAGVIAGLFSVKDGELLYMSLRGIRIYALSIPFMGLNSIIMYYFQAQEKTTQALVISLLSGSVLTTLALLVLTEVFGPEGVWYSWVTGLGASLVISGLIYRSEVKKSCAD